MAKPAELKNKIWRVIDILKWGEEYFQSKGFESPKQEIEWLLCDLLNYKRIDLYIQFEQPILRSDLDKLKAWIKRRTKREPLQYITGITEFYGHKIKVNPNVLIPRPETERLVDVALHCIGNISSPNILEVGTGSGCIPIAIAGEKTDATITAIDVSADALTVAKDNAASNQVEQIQFVEMDFLNSVPHDTYDLLVSNPPYIPESELDDTMIEVRDHEPRIALTDQQDGLSFYHRIAAKAKNLVKPGNWIVLEVGLGSHQEKVKHIFQNLGFNQLEMIQDFNRDDRVLKIQI